MARSLRFLFTVMGVLLLLDQGGKVWVRAAIPLHHATSLIPNLLELTHVENRGVSFSFLGDISDNVRVPLLVSISIVAVALLAYYWLRHRGTMNLPSEFAFVLILPGAIGNLIDRAVFGTVTDYLHFRFYSLSFFVNNLADILISLGVLAYLLGAILANRERSGQAVS
ncbi:MAG: signal peptidase II [SAR324 cluster bacterium]|nr:signal peptidase II [SAR324 cluster bacterium]